MKKVSMTILYLSCLTLFFSCGEEVLTQSSLNTKFQATDVVSYTSNTCAQSRLIKPPVDILFVVDNSGSTLENSFGQIKSQILSTVSTISDNFDYHIYIAPLLALSQNNSSEIHNYPLIASDPAGLTSLNLIAPDSLNVNNFFSSATGGNAEWGFSRAYNLIDSNRSNGIFRNSAHTIIVMVSNGDDNESLSQNQIQGNKVQDPAVFKAKKDNFISLANTLSAESFRFISLVPHSNCNGWITYGNYKQMSSELYNHFNLSDDPGLRNSRDLCSKDYASLFSVVNQSIKLQLQGHSYNHWKIRGLTKTSLIQTNDIKVFKVTQSGATQIEIPENATNGFQYLGYKESQNTRYLPDVGEPQTGHMLKLNGTARFSFPDCLRVQTRTPTEYFGAIALAREPNVSTINVKINGVKIAQSATNGWAYSGWSPSRNIKVAKNGAAATPAVYKSGYFLELTGDAIFESGSTVDVYFKPKVD